MNPRGKIPGLAILTLSLTDCVERNSGPDADSDGIVGDWHAVKVDGEAFPMVLAEGPYMYETGIEMSVQTDLHGQLVLAAHFAYDGYVGGYEQGSTVVVDASEAPKYRIDVTRDPFSQDQGDVGYATDGGYTTSVGYGSSAGYGYDTDPTSGGGTTGADTTGSVHDAAGSSRPLQIPFTPKLAPAEMVLRCTLAADTLDCKRDGDELPNLIVFKRTDDDQS